MFLVHMLCNTYVFSLSCLQTATPPPYAFMCYAL